MIGNRGEQTAELAGWWSGIGTRQIKRQSVFKQAAPTGHGENPITQSVVVKLQPGEAIRVTPKAGSDEVQRVFKIAALRLKIVRAEIHAFCPDGFVQECHGFQPACGNRISNSICGFGKSPGTCTARLRARVTDSHAGPDWFRLKY